eukprot:TRINITY_DN11179_c0_g1_i3.p1 TRINITY_DN11179_c0_g1~~TRINITY_DN11179_c0_g1_i3.p1  ORF type:complete len:560 (+),score=249.25 TRINITY_DN11179_c0_g1_i3:98-1777(+)
MAARGSADLEVGEDAEWGVYGVDWWYEDDEENLAALQVLEEDFKKKKEDWEEKVEKATELEAKVKETKEELQVKMDQKKKALEDRAEAKKAKDEAEKKFKEMKEKLKKKEKEEEKKKKEKEKAEVAKMRQETEIKKRIEKEEKKKEKEEEKKRKEAEKQQKEDAKQKKEAQKNKKKQDDEDDDENQTGSLKEVSSEEEDEDEGEKKRKERMAQAKKKAKELDELRMKKIKEKEEKEVKEEEEKEKQLISQLKEMGFLKKEKEEEEEEEEEEAEAEDGGNDDDDDDDDDDKTDVGEDAFGDIQDLGQALNAGFGLDDIIEEAGEDDLMAMRRAMFGDSDDDEDCSDYLEDAESEKELTDEQIINKMLNPNAGMDGPIHGKRANSSAGRGRAEESKDDVLDAIRGEVQMKLIEVATAADQQFNTAAGNITTVMNSSTTNPKTMVTAAFDQMDVAGLRKITEVVNGNNKDQKIKTIANLVYSNDQNIIKAKAKAAECLKAAMEESLRFALTNQYGNDKAVIDWQTCGSDVLDALSRKMRAAGAEAVRVAQAAAAKAAAGPVG